MAPQPEPSIFGKDRTPTNLLHLKGKVFSFFKLPLELRQQIYDETLVEERTLLNRDFKRIKLLHYPDAHLPLVSRQFRKELQERASKSGVLVVEGNFYDDRRFIPRLLQFAPAAELRLISAYEVSGWSMRPQPGMERLMTLSDFEDLRTRVLDLLRRITAVREVSFDLYLRETREVSETAATHFRGKLEEVMEGCTFESFEVFVQNHMLYKRPLKPWKDGFYREDDQLILRYSHDSNTFQCVMEEEGSAAEEPAQP